MSSFLYYQDFDILDDMQKNLYRQGMAALGGIAPTYRIELFDRPTIVWDIHSLLLGVQMMFSFMLMDEKSTLRVCKHCGNAFIASRPNSVFCSGRWLTPILPYINDSEENIKGILDYCVYAGVKGIICFSMGVTMRAGDREYFYHALDKYFPGMKNKYIRTYGNAYGCPSPNNDWLLDIFREYSTRNGIMYKAEECFRYMHTFPQKYKQMSFEDFFNQQLSIQQKEVFMNTDITKTNGNGAIQNRRW